MRRNTVTLLKLVIAAVIFLAAGPVAVKFLFGGGGKKYTDEYVDVPHGAMPVEPKHVVEKQQVMNWIMKTYMNNIFLEQISDFCHDLDSAIKFMIKVMKFRNMFSIKVINKGFNLDKIWMTFILIERLYFILQQIII